MKCISYIVALSTLTACGNNTLFIPTKASLDPASSISANVRESGDLMRALGFENIDLLSDPALTAVTSEFGFTIIHLKKLPFKSDLAVANVVPWSSWWFPQREKTLFDDSQSNGMATLNKYDLVRKSRDPRLGSAAAFERQSYKPNSLAWEGLCDAWSIASIVMPEPKHSVTISINGWQKAVTFDVVDLKALMLKTYEAVDDSGFKYYGQKFTGDSNGWVFPDIFPDQFHRFLEIQLFQKKQAFIMDHDPSAEVWNVPVFKANYTIDSIPGEPNSVFVRTWVFSAEQVTADKKSSVGTREAIREYNYVLTGIRNSSGDLLVKSGYWTKGPTGVDSRRDHPDYLTTIPDPQRLIRKSWNPEIDIKLVDEILSQSF